MESEFLSFLHEHCSKCLEEVREILNLTIDAFAFEINYSISGYRRLVDLDHGFNSYSKSNFNILKIISAIVENINTKPIWKEHINQISTIMCKYFNQINELIRQL